MLVALTVFSSCEKWLNVSPKTEMKLEQLFKDESGFKDVLIGVYSNMSKNELYGKNLSYGFIDVLAQYYDSPRKLPGVNGNSLNKPSMFKYDGTDEENLIHSIWSSSYGCIVNLNLGIEQINKKESIFKQKNIYHMYRGEYYALRAMLHFDMLRLFAPSPSMDAGKGINALAIPYVEFYTKNPQPQLTVSEVLNKVIADLIIAKESLAKGDPYGPISSDRPKEDDLEENLKDRTSRLNYYAVTTLLARVYLYAGKHDLALAEAKSVIGEPAADPLFFQMATVAANNAAPLFAKEEMFSLLMKDFDKSMENVLIELNTTNQLLTMSKSMQQDYLSLGVADNDFRNNWLKPSKKGDLLLSKYVLAKRITLITIAELYLIAAESAQPAVGMAYLNKLYYHRGRGAIKVEADLKKQIETEYRREMIGNGQMFFFYKRNVALRIGLGNINITNVNDVYNLPIPKKELEFGNIIK